MANLKVKDADINDKYIGSMGLGTDLSPNYNIPADFDLEVSKGNVAGHGKVNKFGVNEDVSANTREDVWTGGGDYPYPATALITSMSQTTDQVAMRGAEIEWQGLDANWEEVVNIINLDASDTTTVITLATPMIRVFRGEVNANVVNDSPIRCHNAGETVDYGIIDTGTNQTTMAMYTVPAGKTAYLKNYYASSVESTGKEPKSTLFALWTADRLKNYEFQLKSIIGIPKAGGLAQMPFEPPTGGNIMSERTDIKITAKPTDEAASVAAGFNLVIIDNI